MSVDIGEFERQARERYERELASDPRQEERLARHECKACYYIIRICGQGFTRYACGRCGGEYMHHNTCVPMLCADCADKGVLCARCGKARD